MAWYSLQSVSEIFLIIRKIKRDVIVNIQKASRKVPAIIFRSDWKSNFLCFFEKYSNIEFHENPSSESRIIPFGARETDRHDSDIRSLFPVLRTNLTKWLKGVKSARFICRLHSMLEIPPTFGFTGFSPWKRLIWRRVEDEKGAVIITGHWPTTFVTSGATCSRRRYNRQNIVDTVGLHIVPGGKSD